MSITTVTPGTTLQRAYAAGASPEIVVDASRGPITIKAVGDPGDANPPTAISLRYEIPGVGTFDGAVLNVQGLSSKNQLEIKPEPAPPGDGGYDLRLRAGAGGAGGTGGDVTVDAGEGDGDAPGYIRIGTGAASGIVSGSGGTSWQHDGDLTVMNGSVEVGRLVRGTEIASSQWIYKPADQSRTSDVLDIDSDLSVNVTPGRYTLRCLLITEYADDPMGIQVDMLSSGGIEHAMLTVRSVSVSDALSHYEVTSDLNSIIHHSTPSSGPGWIEIDGTIEVGGVGGNYLTVRWAQAVTNALPLTVRRGSYLKLDRLAD